MMAEIMGKATGYCRGRGGSMHISSATLNHLGANGIVGGGIPIATGAAMGVKRQGHRPGGRRLFFSDGASNNGVFAESLNMAGIYRLPVVYVLENNHYAVSTPIECATGCCDLAGRGPAYGVSRNLRGRQRRAGRVPRNLQGREAGAPAEKAPP